MNQPKLDRITRDPNVLDGLPTIRDTGITVSEVVKALMNGKTADEVLAEHPQLENEDVIQALVFATDSLLELAAVSCSESRTFTTSIAGFSELLLETWETDDFPDDERREFIGIIGENIQKVKRIFDLLLRWGFINYRQVPNVHGAQIFSLKSVIEAASTQSTKPHDQFSLQITGDLPDVRDYGDLHFALLSLLTSDEDYPLKPATAITTEPKEGYLQMQIYREYKNHSSPNVYPHQIIWQYGSLNIAAHIIRQHGSELKIYPTEDGVTFEFELPIWSETHE